jgi:type I restriction enzyme S subunit
MNMRAKPFKTHLNSAYLNLYMKTGIVKLILLSHAKEAIGQASLNQGQITSLPVPLPPECEQNSIVAIVDELMVICDRLKTRIQETQATQVQLADAIVEQAVA